MSERSGNRKFPPCPKCGGAIVRTSDGYDSTAEGESVVLMGYCENDHYVVLGARAEGFGDE